MIKKIKTLKLKIIRKFAQFYANVLISKMEVEIGTEAFWMTYEQAAKLNAYCVEMHEIYLD